MPQERETPHRGNLPEPVIVQRLQLLLVSGDQGVVEDVRAHLADAPVGADVHPVADTATALQFLRHESTYEASEPPELILVDLENPQVALLLEAIAADPELERLPLVGLTADADLTADLQAAYRLHDVVAKPLGPDSLLRVFAFLDEV